MTHTQKRSMIWTMAITSIALAELLLAIPRWATGEFCFSAKFARRPLSTRIALARSRRKGAIIACPGPLAEAFSTRSKGALFIAIAT